MLTAKERLVLLPIITCPHTSRCKLPSKSQVNDFKTDLLNDAAFSEAQAAIGPFFPDVTKESLLKYAAECRERAKDAENELCQIILDANF